jgi:hypothetical protein
MVSDRYYCILIVILKYLLDTGQICHLLESSFGFASDSDSDAGIVADAEPYLSVT